MPDSLANPANAILSTMEKMNALADVANTKATAAAGSPMPPPPPTPGTSGKKRKRSEASLARDKLVSSKKYQTYKVYEELQRRGIIDDPSEIDKLRKYIHENALLQKQAFDEYNKDYRASIPERSAWFDSKCEFLKEEIKKCDVKQKKAYAMYDDYYVKAKELDACWSRRSAKELSLVRMPVKYCMFEKVLIYLMKLTPLIEQKHSCCLKVVLAVPG